MNKDILDQLTRNHIASGELLARVRAEQDFQRNKSQAPADNTVYLVPDNQAPWHTNPAAGQNPCVNIYATSDTHLDSLIQSKTKNSSTLKEEEEIMKNVRKRADGRYEWRKMVFGVTYSIIKSRLVDELIPAVSKIKREIKTQLKTNRPDKVKQSHKFIDLAWEWFQRNKAGRKSSANYRVVLSKYLNKLDQCITKYVKDDIVDLLNAMTKHRMANYCHAVLKNVFAEATEKGIIKRNPILTLKKPDGKGKKGAWFDLAEQKLLLESLQTCNIGREVLFYLMTGCRRDEAVAMKKESINFEKSSIYVAGTKTDYSKRHIRISATYCEQLKGSFDSMFKYTADYYTKQFRKFLDKLGIRDKALHDLRHTFSTNLFYLGIPDKKRQYLLGHASIVMTNDIYTTMDPNITKDDIIALYGNLYPEF